MFCGSVFDVLAVENVKMFILRGVKAYSLVDRYQHLGGTCYLHFWVVFGGILCLDYNDTSIHVTLTSRYLAHIFSWS
jgi:hypothetical protein